LHKIGIAMTIRTLALPLVVLLGCTAGSLGNGNGGDNNLDPLNPPDPGFPDDPFPGDGVCGDINVVVNGLTPTVQLLIDQSGSMDSAFAGTNRWDAVYRTLMGTDGVVTELADSVRFGLSLYTSHDGSAGGTCPILTEVPAALGNYDAINGIFAPAGPDQDTPTGESIAAVAGELKQINDPGPKIIVLGTDGEPDTCAEPNPQNGQAEAIAAAQAAFGDGIRTYIISVGDEVGADHLQQMANAGVGLPPTGAMTDAPYYQALDTSQLIDAFRAIVGGVTGCVFTIDGEVDPAKAAQGLVKLDGTPLDEGTDWQMVDGKTFEVLGDACDTIQDGHLHHVAAVFPCGVVIVN